jgi:hypothetical protein
MEKYGVMKEEVCECGYRIILPGNQLGSGIVKSAGKAEEGHVHVMKQVEEDNGRGSDPSPDVRPQ